MDRIRSEGTFSSSSDILSFVRSSLTLCLHLVAHQAGALVLVLPRPADAVLGYRRVDGVAVEGPLGQLQPLPELGVAPGHAVALLVEDEVGLAEQPRVLGRLVQDDHLGGLVGVAQLGHLVLQLVEVDLEVDAALTLHRVVQVPQLAALLLARRPFQPFLRPPQGLQGLEAAAARGRWLGHLQLGRGGGRVGGGLVLLLGGGGAVGVLHGRSSLGPMSGSGEKPSVSLAETYMFQKVKSQ